MSFQPDWCFESLTEAFNYILGQYSLQPNAHVWARIDVRPGIPTRTAELLVPERVRCLSNDHRRREAVASGGTSWRVSTVQHGRGAAWKARFQSGGTALQGTLQPRSDGRHGNFCSTIVCRHVWLTSRRILITHSRSP